MVQSAATQSAVSRRGLSLTAFLAATNDLRQELIADEWVVQPPIVALHNIVHMRLLMQLHRWCEQYGLGVVLAGATFVQTDPFDPNWVIASCTPDILFFSLSRFDAYQLSDPDWLAKPYLLSPDFVAEIVSPLDDLRSVDKKIQFCLKMGARGLWAVDPSRQEVALYTPDSETSRILRRGATLTDSDVLPGFSLALNDLFAEG